MYQPSSPSALGRSTVATGRAAASLLSARSTRIWYRIAARSSAAVAEASEARAGEISHVAKTRRGSRTRRWRQSSPYRLRSCPAPEAPGAGATARRSREVTRAETRSATGGGRRGGSSEGARSPRPGSRDRPRPGLLPGRARPIPSRRRPTRRARATRSGSPGRSRRRAGLAPKRRPARRERSGPLPRSEWDRLEAADEAPRRPSSSRPPIRLRP